MPRLPFPSDVPEGSALHTLLVELHDLHAHAGWPGTRRMEKSGVYSHSVVHQLFTKNQLPRFPVLVGVVERLAALAPDVNVEDEKKRFAGLWKSADREDKERSAPLRIIDSTARPEKRLAYPVTPPAGEADAQGDPEPRSQQESISQPDDENVSRNKPRTGRPVVEVDPDEASAASGEVPEGLIVLAVDDHEPSLDEIAYLLSQDPRVGLVLKASDSTEALRILNSRRISGESFSYSTSTVDDAIRVKAPAVEAVFLDIQMPGLDGLELARVFSSMAVPPSVVFVTGYDDRAVDAYEVGAVDYLLKPIRSERLAASIARILANRAATVAEPQPEQSTEDEVIPVKLADTTKRVPRSAVRYVEAEGDYARLHTDEGSYHVDIPLSVLEDRWRDAGFIRINRSFLVSLPLVTDLRPFGSGYVVRVGREPHSVELPVSRRHTRELKDRIARATKQARGQR